MLDFRADAGAARATEELRRELGISSLLARVLVGRGYADPGRARAFLDPRLDQIHDPFLLADCDRAATRLRRAIHRGETILVYGDYDVDGLTALAVLVHFIRFAGGRVHTYVPNRTREAYSLNREGLEAIARARATLVVTTDSGVGSHEEIRTLAHRGVDVIVTDHHDPDDTLPEAMAILNPKRGDCEYPFKSLCGVGVAFKLVSAVVERTPRDDEVRERLETFLTDALAWVALGTVADVVPLVGENRALVAFGLRSLESSVQPGLKALRTVSRLGRRSIGTRDVAFALAPRLNAAGRMGRVEDAVRLLLSEDGSEAREAARALDAHNRERRVVQARILDEARTQLANRREAGAVVVWGEGWPVGVLGIVAGALSRETNRPCLVIGVAGDRARGSSRGPAHAPVLPLLRKHADLLDAFGGHAAAAGFDLAASRVAALADRLAAERFEPTPAGGDREPDLRVSLSDLTVPAVRELRRLEPHGTGNPAPLLAVRNVRLGGTPTRVPARPGRWALWLTDGEVGHRLLIRRDDLPRYPVGRPMDVRLEARWVPTDQTIELEAAPLTAS